MTPPVSGTRSASSVTNPRTSPGIDAAGLTRVLEEKFESFLTSAFDCLMPLDTKPNPTYLFETPEQIRALLDHPEVKDNLAAFARTLKAPCSPNIVMSPEAMAELSYRMGAESNTKPHTEAAFRELAKLAGNAGSVEQWRAYEAGKAGKPYSFAQYA